MAEHDDRSFGRPSREEGASVAGWAGPGGRKLRARDIDDVRHATYGGVRRHPGRARRAVQGAPPSVQFGLAFLAIVVMLVAMGVLGALSNAGNDGRQTIWDAVDITDCRSIVGKVVVAGFADGEEVVGQVNMSRVATFDLEVSVSDDAGALGSGVKSYAWATKSEGPWRFQVTVTVERPPGDGLECSTKLVAVGR